MEHDHTPDLRRLRQLFVCYLRILLALVDLVSDCLGLDLDKKEATEIKFYLLLRLNGHEAVQFVYS